MKNNGLSQNSLNLSRSKMPIAPSASQMLLRTFIGVTALVNLTACTSDLDDPFGIKARRTEDRRAECQQVYEITRASYDQVMATYDQEIFYTDIKLTQAGYLKHAEIEVDTANSLESLELSNKDLNLLKSYLAASFRHQAAVSRDLAPFAEAERNITSANERSKAYQAVIAREDPYVGLEYAIEVYCEGGDMPSAP
ncbi:hypothetical protein N836_24340 [Leptolyngbya sp. Heron Island J]|nr:hypothetical protein N836_24340 [Leptolyngbya sp. Heron Island J]